MRNRDKGPFLHAAMRAVRETEHVLNFNRIPWQRGAPFDLRPHIAAMSKLCEEQHLDSHPVEHLRHMARVIDGLRGPIDLSELKAGEQSGAQYEQWLSSAFQETFAQMRKEDFERTSKHALN